MKRFKTTYQFQVSEQKCKLFGLNSKAVRFWVEICFTTSLENGSRVFSYLGGQLKLVIFANGVRVKPKWPHVYLPNLVSKEELVKIMEECWQDEMEVETQLKKFEVIL